MSQIARRLSVPELSERILEMARTGVYRESVFEALQPLATKQQIRQAIAHAKQFGLHSVASLRDGDLGTYYQTDLVKYQKFQPTLEATIPLLEQGELAKRHLEAIALLQRMLFLSRAAGLGLASIGVLSVFSGHPQMSSAAFSGAICTSLLWLLQRSLARRIEP